MKKIVKFVLVLLCMLTIFFFSSDNADQSNKKSDGVIIRTSEILLGRELNNREKENIINRFVIPVRKTAHFTIYFILGLCFINLLKEYMVIDKRSIVYTILFVAVYACSDELHQLFVSGRSGELLDVFIDTTGGFVGSIVYKIIYDRRRKHEQEKTVS